MNARVVVITDRRLYGDEIARAIAAILAAVPRGAVAIQIREKDLDGGPLLRLAREIMDVARPAGAPVWINDRVDLALIAGADGVHLPEDGLAMAEARTLAADRTLHVGVSRHAAAAAIAAGADGANLVQLGPIFATPGKVPCGPEILGVRSQLAPATRLVAVGGIDSPERAREAASAGADAVAVIRAVWSARDPATVVQRLLAAVDTGVHDRLMARR